MKKKTVGIATFTGIWFLNYGSTLQTLALQKLFRDNGFNAVSSTLSFAKLGNKYTHGFARFKKRFFSMGMPWLWTFLKFYVFVKKHKGEIVCHVSEFTDTKEAIEYAKKHFDILCVGSDAIWRDWFIRPFFLWDFEELRDIPKFSYAASVNDCVIPREKVRDVLDYYKAISVREYRGKEIMQEFTNNDISVVLDPTLAVGEEYWKKKSKKRLVDQSYVLVYIIDGPGKYRDTIEEVKKWANAERIVYINTDIIDKSTPACTEYIGDEFKRYTGPAEFLSLIQYSKAVVTDSFHGCSFSIVFRKDFFVLERKLDDLKGNRDCRINDLMSRLSIDNRMVLNNDQIRAMSPIDYGKVEPALDKERNNSLTYIRMALDLCMRDCGNGNAI